jgi:hypothetical protein
LIPKKLSAEDLIIENERLKLKLNEHTYLPELIFNKSNEKLLNLKMEIVRYRGTLSQSGSYIMAPASEATPIKIEPIEGFLYDSAFMSFAVIFYKNPYKSTCLGFL